MFASFLVLQSTSLAKIYPSRLSRCAIVLPYTLFFSIKSQNKNQVIPRVVNDCINYIEMIGLDTEGIFRRSVSVATVRNVQKIFNEG